MTRGPRLARALPSVKLRLFHVNQRLVAVYNLLQAHCVLPLFLMRDFEPVVGHVADVAVGDPVFDVEIAQGELVDSDPVLVFELRNPPFEAHSSPGL